MDVTISTTLLNYERRTCVSLLERAVFVTRSMAGAAAACGKVGGRGRACGGQGVARSDWAAGL